jgi:hypothetical protein
VKRDDEPVTDLKGKQFDTHDAAVEYTKAVGLDTAYSRSGEAPKVYVLHHAPQAQP